MVQRSLFLGNLLRLLGGDVYLFFVFGRLSEVSNAFAKPFTDLRQFPSTKNDQHDDQDNDQLWQPYSS